jgi:hypothetical protein
VFGALGAVFVAVVVVLLIVFLKSKGKQNYTVRNNNTSTIITGLLKHQMKEPK